MTNEEAVTKILSNHEIIARDYVEELFEGNKTYTTSPEYDLTGYLNQKQQDPKRFDPKYLFVK